MAKYYVESGSLQMVVQAEDAHRAALWAVHRVVEDLISLYDDPFLSHDEKLALVLEHGFSRLGEELRINQQGFGHAAEWRRLSFELLAEWDQLMVAVTRLEGLLAAA